MHVHGFFRLFLPSMYRKRNLAQQTIRERLALNKLAGLMGHHRPSPTVMPHSLITPKRHEADRRSEDQNYGAMRVAGSLHPLWPSDPIAATRNQYFFPLVRFWIVLLATVTVSACPQLSVLGGSGLIWMM